MARRSYPDAMKFMNSPQRYGAMSQTLHWLTVILVVLAWALGEADDILPKGPALAAGLLVHIWAGNAVICLVGVRFLWRLLDPPPAPERTALGAWLDRAGRLAHYLLYALLLAAPVAGIALQFARGDTLPVFGIFEIASPWMADRAFARSVKGVHELLANSLVILAGVHAAAALFHHWILRDRTLLRMMPHGTK
jgi:cytochrome b561